MQDLNKENRDFDPGLLDHHPNPIVITNPDTSIRYVNPAFEKVSGYTAAEVISRRSPYPWWPPESAHQYEKEIVLIDDKGNHYQERLYVKKDGTHFQIVLHMQAIGEAGKPICFVSTWISVPENTDNIDCVQIRELRSMFEQSFDGLMLVSSQGIITGWNYSLERLTGIKPGDALGQFVWNIHYKMMPDTKKVLTGVQTLQDNFNEFVLHRDSLLINRMVEEDMQRFDGEVRRLQYLPFSVETGKSVNIGVVFRDITDQRKAENALRESEAFSASLLNESPNPIMLTLPDSTIKYVNPALEKLTGFSSSELIGLQAPFPWWPPDKSCIYLLSGCSFGKTELFGEERRFRKKSGEEFWVNLTVKHFRYNGQTEHYLSNWVDITERKIMEERIIDLYKKEKEQRQELQEEAKSRGMFIDILAHELRAPLTPILASTGILKDIAERQTDVTQKRLVINIYNSAKTLAGRLEELLDLARYTRGMVKLNIQSTDLNRYLEEVASRFMPILEKRNQQLEMYMPRDLPCVEMDSPKLEQVLINLLSNASKFSPDCGTIKLKASINDRDLQIDIEDKGIGIPEDEQASLFQPYHRAGRDRQQIPGLGLGLAVSRHIVEAHGGKIWLVSQPGEGSTFSFSIPRVRG